MYEKRRGLGRGGIKDVRTSKLQLTMTEQMRAGTRRSMPTIPPKKKQRKNPTRVRVR